MRMAASPPTQCHLSIELCHLVAALCKRLQHHAAAAVLITGHGSHASKVRECKAATCFGAKQSEGTFVFHSQ